MQAGGEDSEERPSAHPQRHRLCAPRGGPELASRAEGEGRVSLDVSHWEGEHHEGGALQRHSSLRLRGGQGQYNVGGTLLQ